MVTVVFSIGFLVIGFFAGYKFYEKYRKGRVTITAHYLHAYYAPFMEVHGNVVVTVSIDTIEIRPPMFVLHSDNVILAEPLSPGKTVFPNAIKSMKEGK